MGWISKFAKITPQYKQEVWWMLEKLTGQKKNQLIMAGHGLSHLNWLPLRQQKILDQWLTQRIQDRKPLQYILGDVPFCNLNLMCRPPTFIPRPETEEWCWWVIRNLRKQLTHKSEQSCNIQRKNKPLAKCIEHERLHIENCQSSFKSNPFVVYDLCTGTGCCALSIAKHCNNIHDQKKKVFVLGVDKSPEAVDLAIRNRDRLEIDDTTVQFIMADICGKSLPYWHDLEQMKFGQESLPLPHLIVSNPPYIPQDMYHLLQPEIQNWEDHTALFSPPLNKNHPLKPKNIISWKTQNIDPDGGSLFFYKKIINLAAKLLRYSLSNTPDEHNDEFSHMKRTTKKNDVMPFLPSLVLEIGYEWQVNSIIEFAKKAGFHHINQYRDQQNLVRWIHVM